MDTKFAKFAEELAALYAAWDAAMDDEGYCACCVGWRIEEEIEELLAEYGYTEDDLKRAAAVAA
jgi:hypothetical protein